ncbi:MAG: MBL fold metallo-hydrolase, partial [Deltaproteobacteria bacterium]|nr:MBL fold metallo-hydrolase [Deltaproteobacteria bacterium]
MTKSSSPNRPKSRASRVQKRLGLNERLGLIALIDEGMRLGSSGSPIVADLFNDLWDLVNKTVSGSRIDRLKPEESPKGFRIIEINAETGENLGRLNMLYLRKPIPCYYLVYVEVAAPFRKRGLGNRILQYFRDFLIRKSAVGILDNIIPHDDPTYDVYFKQAWEPIEAIIGEAVPDTCENYMIYVPPNLHDRDLREPVLKLVHHLKRKRTAIDMRDNEILVQRTIAEFKALYSALLTYFEEEIRKGEPNSLTRFIFTRFATKFIAFRRHIANLIGYTGGDSLEQIGLAPEIAGLPVQSYAPSDLASSPTSVSGDMDLHVSLPEDLKNHPAPCIEMLPNYQRPSLLAWLKEREMASGDALTIGDLMDLGFDPTRLKEITIHGDRFIFERIQARQLPELEKKKELLNQIESKLIGARPKNALLQANPPLLAIGDRGNAYVLRRKIEGIHWEEAVEQLQSAPHLKAINRAIGIDKMVLATVRKANDMIAHELG